MVVILRILKYLERVNFDIKYEKKIANHSRNSIFDAFNVIYHATPWHHNWPSIFTFKWNCDIFRNTDRIFLTNHDLDNVCIISPNISL